jgi:peptidoglycan/LPS O-acetylase OafA/YrhL
LGIFPNIANALNMEWPTSPQIWSIGVEEQFYIFWPLLIYLIPQKRLVTWLLIFFIGYTMLPHGLRFANGVSFKSGEINDFIDRFFYQSKFNCMSIGGIFGYLYAADKKALAFFYKDFIAYPAIILSFVLWFIGFKTNNFNDVLYSVLFVVMIVNIAGNKNLKLNLDFKPSRFLGRISYGIYMYHWIIILLVMKYLPYTLFGSSLLYNGVLYLCVVSFTILAAYISFISFEKYFLKIKEKYEIRN